MTRERKKETGGRTYSWKALRHSLTCSQNKGLYKYQRRANQLQTGASPHQRQRGRQVTEEPEARGNVGPRDGILHQTVRRLPVANQVFLGSWTVGIHQEGHSQRSAPQRNTRPTRDGAPAAHPGNWAAGMGEVIGHTVLLGQCAPQAPGCPSCSDLGRAQNTGPAESVPLWSTREPEP